MSMEMRDSGIPWIGEIPKDWSAIKLLYVLRARITDGPHETPVLVDDGIPFISIDSLNDSDTIDLSNVRKFISYDDYLRYNQKSKIEKGDILFTKAATIGKTAIVRDEVFMVWSPLAIIKADYNIINNRFLYHILNTDNLIKDVILHGSNNTQINVGMRELEAAIIPLPSLAEQQRIAEFLDKKCGEVDEMIALQEQIIEELKAYKQSVITEAVTKGLNSNVPMKDSGIEWIGEIPEHWEMIRLRYLGKTQNGISKGGEYFGEGNPFVSYSDVYKNMELPKSVSGLIQSSLDEQHSFSVQKGDIFFTRTSETIEEIGISSTCMHTINNAVFAGFLIRFRPHQGYLHDGYSKYYFRSNIHRIFFIKEMNIVTRASLSQDLLKSLIVLLPPITEQQAIADYLDKKCGEIDKLISIKQQKIESLKEYKKSIIYEYVTGKKEVV